MWRHNHTSKMAAKRACIAFADEQFHSGEEPTAEKLAALMDALDGWVSSGREHLGRIRLVICIVDDDDKTDKVEIYDLLALLIVMGVTGCDGSETEETMMQRFHTGAIGGEEWRLHGPLFEILYGAGDFVKRSEPLASFVGVVRNRFFVNELPSLCVTLPPLLVPAIAEAIPEDVISKVHAQVEIHRRHTVEGVTVQLQDHEGKVFQVTGPRAMTLIYALTGADVHALEKAKVRAGAVAKMHTLKPVDGVYRITGPMATGDPDLDRLEVFAAALCPCPAPLLHLYIDI